MAPTHSIPTSDQVRRLIRYDPDTGVFTWRRRGIDTRTGRTWDTRYAGKTAGSIDRIKTKNFRYLRIGILRRVYRANQVAWVYMTGEWAEFAIEHIDGNNLNNLWRNLRRCRDQELARRMERRCLPVG